MNGDDVHGVRSLIVNRDSRSASSPRLFCWPCLGLAGPFLLTRSPTSGPLGVCLAASGGTAFRFRPLLVILLSSLCSVLPCIFCGSSHIAVSVSWPSSAAATVPFFLLGLHCPHLVVLASLFLLLTFSLLALFSTLLGLASLRLERLNLSRLPQALFLLGFWPLHSQAAFHGPMPSGYSLAGGGWFYALLLFATLGHFVL